MNKNKKRIVLGSLIGVMVIALAFVVTRVGAWLTDQKETDEIILQVGRVQYNLEGATNLFVENPVVPGQNLVEGNSFTISNASTVDSQIRFIYTVTYDHTDMGADYTGDAIVDGLLLTTFDSVWVEGAADDYYYLNDTTGVMTPSDTEANNIISSLVLNGSVVGNIFAEKEFTIKFVFQAKQADHLTWEEAGSIDFVTGI